MLQVAVGIGALVLTAAGLLAWNSRLPRPAVVDAWADQHGLAPDERTPAGEADWESVRRQLRHGRMARTLGFLVAFVVGEGAVLLWAQPLPPVPLSVLANPSGWVAGYLIGAIAAELTRPRPGQVHAAALAPRRLADYVHPRLLPAERAVAVAAIALAPLAAHTAPRRPWTSPLTNAGVVDGIVAALVALLVEVGLRLMVRRAQPVASRTELAVDDAIRSTAVDRAAAAGLATQLFLLGDQAWNAFLHARWLGTVSFLLALVCVILAIGTWNGLGTRGWWPSRRANSAGPPPPARPSRPPGQPGSGGSPA
jgi:hypothetical protein